MKSFFVFAILIFYPALATGVDTWRGIATGKYVVLMRHALAPGTGDPAGFELDDCATQRNLSITGTLQAERIGALFRRNQVPEAMVFSSQWCRCLDTARSLDIGPTLALALLNSFYHEPQRAEGQTSALSAWLQNNGQSGPLVLVTHQVNITALTGVYPPSGGMVVVDTNTDGTVRVVDKMSIEPPLAEDPG